MESIKIKNACINNLKNIDVEIPKNKLIVVTGVSGSGKSSLAFDLIFEEGRKKYLQSIGMAIEFGDNKYSEISGLSPTVAVKQNFIRQSNPRSTIGSKTGLLNRMTLLFANEGKAAHNEWTFDKSHIEPNIFSYLSPTGMCLECGGSGKKFDINMENIIIDDMITVEKVFQNIGATKGYLNLLEKKYKAFFHLPFSQVPEEIQDELTYGTIDNASGKISYCIVRVLHIKYLRGEEIQSLYSLNTCEACEGYRVGDEARQIFIDGYHIGEIASMTLLQAKFFFEELLLKNKLSTFGVEMLNSILKTLGAFINIKLGHLTMYREMPTLSGGELQRVFLHDHLESKLDSLIYVFDEPTSGLHESEKTAITDSLQLLKKQGNTVIIVSHDRHVIRQADYIIDIGPSAGIFGGEIVFKGTYVDFLKSKKSITAKYLTQNSSLSTKRNAVNAGSKLCLHNADLNNLKNVSVEIPLDKIVGIAAVSGSGKSSLISKTLVPLVKEKLKNNGNKRITGIENIQNIIEITQAPIGRKSNSNPVSYLGVWDKVRELFAQQPLAISRKLKAGNFSFNSKGACPHCNGGGVETISIGFDIQFNKTCTACKGARFNPETLNVSYKDKNIYDVLEMSVSEALSFFNDHSVNLNALKILEKIGMGYVKLGQPTSTLSGGEAQRIKLAKEIGKIKQNNTLYILDEPSTGLGQYDISKLLYLLNELTNQGNSVIVVEHDLDILKCCDWIIELGKGSGNAGGEIIAQGTPSDLKRNSLSITGGYL